MAKITFNTALLINGTLDIEIDCYSLLASAKSGTIPYATTGCKKC